MKRLLPLFAGLCLLTVEAAAEPVDVVERLHAGLLAAMQLDTHSEREAYLQPIIADVFDNRRIAGISLGRTWRDLSAQQRAEFEAKLLDLVVATYADRFDNFNGQQFVTDGVQAVKNNVVVQTRLQRADADDVKLDYVLREGRVFNVVADGVSDLSLRRADYNSIIKQEGYDSLLEHLAEKTAAARADNRADNTADKRTDG